jgi:hypothetical protein
MHVVTVASGLPCRRIYSRQTTRRELTGVRFLRLVRRGDVRGGTDARIEIVAKTLAILAPPKEN